MPLTITRPSLYTKVGAGLQPDGAWCSNRPLIRGGIFALRAHCALLLDYVPLEEPPSTPLGNALRIR